MGFQKLLDEFMPEGDDLSREVRKLLDRKLAGDELDLEPKIEIINEFVESEIGRFEGLLMAWDHNVPAAEPLEDLFRAALKETFR